MPASGSYNISAALQKLSTTHPGLTVSKLRYLDSEGIVSPQRTKSGYRVYTDDDIKKLDLALKMQEQYYYPLHIIKEKLQTDDISKLPEYEGAPTDTQKTIPQAQPSRSQYLLDEVQEEIGVPISFIRSMAAIGIISLAKDAKGRDIVDGYDLSVIRDAYELKRYGIDPRFLKPYIQQVNRELPVFRQVLMAVVGRQGSLNDPQIKSRFDETFENISILTERIHRSLLTQAIRHDFNLPTSPSQQ